ncbi:MAG: hypothetical protein AB8H79_02450 [Myxococcota bacterium]
MSEPYGAGVPEKAPQNVQIVGILMLIGGIFALLVSLTVLLSTLCIWVFAFYGIIAGIFAIISASKLLGSGSRGSGVPTTAAILLIINIVSFDTIGMIMGIISLVLLNDEDTKAWLTADTDVLT